MKRTTRTQRVVADLTAMVLVGTQLVLPPNAEASHLGSSTASAGSAPPPAASAIQSFQPDLFTGRATLAIPIALPPGRKGVQPSLALTYSSSGRNGWVGDSWMVDVSYLERSTKNGVPTYDASDTFTFVSQNTSVDLVQIPDGTYRAKDEGAFLRFESKGVSGWEVRDKSGMRYFFGQTAVSQIESAGKVFRWALEKVIDPSGNTILYTYAKDQNQLYLSRIDYTGHEPTSAAPTNQILFTLEDRPDKDTSLRSGFPVTTAKRLKTIEAKATVDTVVSLARRYDLTYATSTRTGRSLLTSVTQVGSDGTTTLPPSTFTYQQSANTSSLTTPGQSLKQLLVGDVEGNGSAELINYDATSATWTVACATASCPGLSTGTWMTGFGTATDIPLVGDWNGDGRTDVGLYNASNGHQWQFATSGGGSFVIQAAWGLVFGSGTPLSGDFNGDGKTDVGTYDNGTWSIALGTGSGFTTPALFNLSWGAAIYDPLIGDFNGDGLTDIALVENATGNISVRLSTGAGWTEATTWLTGFGPNQEHTSADFTEDGLSDVVYYDHATGRVMVAPSTGSAFGAAVSLPVTFTQTSTNDVLQMGDFNGDGLLDPAVFNSATGSAQLSFSQGSPADLLLSVANGLGGATSLTYQPSSILGHTTLPFITSVVQTITTSDGLGNTYATTYNYDGGLYDAPTKEFRGFAKTQVLDAEHQVALTQFHQDEHRKGHVVHSEFRDTFGNLWTQTDQTWVCTDLFPNVHFTHLDQTDAVTYDGDATSKQTRARFTYDAYGNLTRTDEDGEVTLTGDERSTMTAFLYNPTDWILNTPSLVQTLDATSTVVAQRRFFYDGAASHTTAPTVGNLTKEEEWLNLPTEQWLATSLTYDAYGNVTTVTDALSRTTTNTYDPTGTYLIQIQNTLGHTRQLIYDPRFGSVTSSTDQNTQTTTTQYDPLGRVLKVIGPTDTATLPTISYAYDLSTLPNKTTVSTRVQSGSPNVLTVYAFSDGLGRTIQTRSPAEDPAKQVVTGTVQFNSRGLVTKQWVAYLDTFSTSYRPLSLVTDYSSLATVSYTYDPLGRTLTLTDPDGSVTSTTYHDWDVTVTDALGHQTTRTSDAYGRLSKVEEFNGAAVYTTTYQYDPRNNLTKVTDHAGHLTTITYDSLNRKRSMDDPDMGHWSYTYDAVDNLTSQTDARGVTTNFTYDALNRLTHKEYLDAPLTSHLAPVTYTYDNPVKSFSTGKLTEITDGSGSSAFEYDALGRLVKESKTVDGTTSTIQRTYDLLGRLLTLTYPTGDVATYTYNPQGGIETIDLSSATLPLSHLVTDVQYNAAGQLTKLTYGNGTISDYTYHPQTLRLSQLKTTGPSGTLQDFGYTFDAVGNVTAITDHVHTATQSFQYDALNRLTQAVGSYGPSTYAYDPLGNMTSKEGATMTYGLPEGGTPHAVTSVTNLGPAASSLQLTYDANGNLLEKTPCPTPLAPCPTSQRFQYDAENRLTEVQTAPEETVTLTFTPGWNFFSLPVIPEDAHITALLPNFSANFEQVAWFDTALSTPTEARFQHFVNDPLFNDFDTLQYGQGYQLYCENPNGVTITLKGKLPTKQATTTLLPGWHLLPAIAVDTKPLSWLLSGIDYEQVQRYDTTTSSLTPPTEAKPGEAYFVKVHTVSTWTPPLPREVTTQFVYDGDGGKVKQITASGTTTLLGEVFETAPEGKTTTYVFAGVERICAVVRGPSTVDYRYYHGDHLGSSNVVTDATGAVVEVAEYTPYGSLATHSGTADVAHKFTGQRQDAGTGLILFPGRAYDPQLGRFLQADPFVQDPADPQMLNRYSYVRNNPLNFTDPSGYKKKHRSFFHILAIVAAVVAIVATAAIAAPVIAGTATLAEAAATTTIAGIHATTLLAGGISTAIAANQIAQGDGATAAAATSPSPSPSTPGPFTPTPPTPGALADPIPNSPQIPIGDGAPPLIRGIPGDGGPDAPRGGPLIDPLPEDVGQMATALRASEAPKPTDDVGQTPKPTGQEKGKRNTPEQEAVIKLAKEAKRRDGVTPAEAKVLEQLAKQAGVPFRGPESHPNRPYGSKPHIHIGPVDHIPVR